MNILVIGSGGREHAICSTFRRSARVDKIWCANGNAGIGQVAECVPILPDNIPSLISFSQQNPIDLTFVGPEVPLALGIVDAFQAAGLKIVGPSKAAAELEASKSFAKDFMARHGIPTARYVTAHSPDFAVLELESGDFGGSSTPVVVKADGLAAGKGVVVAANREEAVAAINDLPGVAGNAATSKIVLEECLTGRELSLLAFVDGEDFVLMPPTRDHKRIGDGDTGPNTGGMGAITDASLLSPEQLKEIADTIVRPTLHGCVREDLAFRGILFIGLMMTAAGPQVLEYNVRFGDPETQAILVRLETDLVDICDAMLQGRLRDLDVGWRSGASACVVIASQGYPGRARTGDVITGLNDAASAPGVQVFHAGTAVGPDGSVVTSGGRVLGVTSVGGDLDEALARAYSAADKIHFDGAQFRHDIGK